MTDPNRTAIMLIVDRSGSMNALRVTAQAAINEFINAQKGNNATIAVAQFDNIYELVTPSVSAALCPAFNLKPRGGTALLDAMGRGITDFGAELAAMPEDERPGTVILGIVTDGEENSSVEYDWKTVQEMVQRQENEYSWQVVYLASGQDAIATGAKMGVQAHRSMTYAASGLGTRSAYSSFSGVVAAAAAGGQSISFSEADRLAAMEEDE
jgi:Mg-chelatase subunit ChlD